MIFTKVTGSSKAELSISDESMIQSERFLPIDGTSGIEEQQQLVRKKIAEIIPQDKGPIRIVKKQVLKDAVTYGN